MASTEGHLKRHNKSVHLSTYQSLQKMDLIKNKYSIHEGQNSFEIFVTIKLQEKNHLKRHYERINTEKTCPFELSEFESKVNSIPLFLYFKSLNNHL